MSCKRIKSEEAVPMFVPPVEAPEDIVRDAVPDAATTGVPDEVSDVVPKNVAKEPTNDVQELPIGPAFNDFEDCGVYVVRRVLEDQNYHVEYKKPSRSSLGEVPRRNHPLTKSEDSRLLLEWQPDWIAREYFSDAFYEEMAYLYEVHSIALTPTTKRSGGDITQMELVVFKYYYKNPRTPIETIIMPYNELKEKHYGSLMQFFDKFLSKVFLPTLHKNTTQEREK